MIYGQIRKMDFLCVFDGCENPLSFEDRKRCDEHLGMATRRTCKYYNWKSEKGDLCENNSIKEDEDYIYIKKCKKVCTEYQEFESYIGK